MKRNVICTFAMVLWFLIFSTLFSVRVEQLMTPIVTERVPAATQTSTELKLDLDCLFPGEDGAPVLYQTYEGLDWEAGVRVKLATPASYTVMEDHISCGALQKAIQYATRDLRLGEKVTVANTGDTREELYLAVCPTGIRLRGLPENLSILEKTESALMAKGSQAPTVFMPKRAAGKLFQRQPFMLPDERVYSLVDVKDFFRALPLAALLPGIMLFVLLLWIFSFPLLRDLRKALYRLIANGCLAAVSLILLPVLLHLVQFPSSLLPKNNIVDVSHYITEFSEIFKDLHLFAELGVSEAQSLLAYINMQIWLSVGIVVLCAVLSICVSLSHYKKTRKQ